MNNFLTLGTGSLIGSRPKAIPTPTITLLGLALDVSEVDVDTSVTINISNATEGSVITGTMPAGLTLNSAARTITGTATEVATNSIDLTETLEAATNSPRVSTVSLEVAAVEAPVPSLIDTTDMSQHRTVANSELIDVDSFQFYRDGGLIGDIRFTLAAGNYRVTADISAETLSGTSKPVQFRMLDTGTQLYATTSAGAVSFDITTSTTSLRFLNGTNAGCRVDNFKIVALP